MCWGYEFDGQAQPPAGEHRAISVGAHHACALSAAGSVSCWMVYDGVLDLPASLRQPSAPPVVDLDRGRILARRLADGCTEFAWLPAGAQQPVLPTRRYVPTNAQVGRWLRSSPIEVSGVAIGRISARLRSNGRIEAAFTPTGGERILPPSRQFPIGADVGRWRWSAEIAPAK